MRSVGSVARDLGRIGPLVLLQTATACGSAPRPTRLLLEVAPAERANFDSPIPVSFVAVKDPKFLEQIVQMTAKDWFEKRVQLHRDDPSGQQFTEWMWEFVPGYSPRRVVIEVEGGTVASIFFANYRMPGDHRVRVGPMRRLRVELENEDVTIRSLDTAQNP